MKALLKSHFLSLTIIISVSILSLWPLLQDPARRVPDKWDGVLMVWYLNTTISKIPSNLKDIFQGNIFYPNKNVMAYSDMHIPSAVVSYLPTALSHEPVVALNTSLLFGQITTIFILYIWFWSVTKNRLASLLASLAVGVSATRISFIEHLQMWNHQWWLTAALFFWIYFKEKKVRYLIVSALFLGVQMWESPLGVYFAAFVMFAIAVRNIKRIVKNKKILVLFFLISVLIMILPVHTYLSVSREFNFIRTIRDAARFSPGADVLIKNIFTDGIFMGFFILMIFKKARVKIMKEKWLIGILASGLVLSLGPVIKIQESTFKIFNKIFIPLPYGILYCIIPGFSAFRAPGRWIWIALFATGFLLAISFSEIIKKDNRASKFFYTFIVAILILFPLTKKISYFEFKKVSEYPPVYSYLQSLPRGVLLELPIYSWVHGDIASIETYRMVYSLFHGKYLLGGVSGFEPPSWNDLRNLYWQSFPSDEFDNLLRDRGVKYILIWKDLMEKDKLMKVEVHYKNLLYEDKFHVLYSL